MALFFGFQNLGLLFTSAGNAALIQTGVPAAAAVLAYLFLNERIPRKRLLGVGLSVLGVLLVSGAMPTGGDPLYLLGNALIVGSVLAYGAYATQGKALRTGDWYPATVAPGSAHPEASSFVRDRAQHSEAASIDHRYSYKCLEREILRSPYPGFCIEPHHEPTNNLLRPAYARAQTTICSSGG